MALHIQKALTSALLIFSLNAPAAMLAPSRALPSWAFAATQEPQKLTLLSSGVASFWKRLQMVQSATKTIDTEFYIYHSDVAGRLFTQALIQKARAGVRVRILVDRGFGNLNLNPLEARLLTENGIQFRYYNETSLLNFKKANHRSHRKSVIVDGNAAFIGGRNMSEDYFDFSPDYNMMDQDVLVQGTITQAIQESFEQFWSSSYAKPAQIVTEPRLADYGMEIEQDSESIENGEKRLRKFKRDHKSYTVALAQAQDFIVPSEKDRELAARVSYYGEKIFAETAVTETCNETYYLADLPGPSGQSRVVYDFISKFISSAQNSLTIESPFFVRTESQSLIQSALDRGVKVDVLTNSLFSAKVAIAIAPALAYASSLTKGGASVYVYEGESPRWLDFSNFQAKTARWGSHAKLLVVDEDSISVGSFNLDPRSAFLNAEMTLVCRGNLNLASTLKHEFEARKSIAVKLDRNANPVDGRSKFFNIEENKKFLYYLTKPLAHLFESLL
ncbi:MAG: phospholipase D-like domain-containing protein [Pseudobdellovibrionaceae bacterium]